MCKSTPKTVDNEIANAGKKSKSAVNTKNISKEFKNKPVSDKNQPASAPINIQITETQSPVAVTLSHQLHDISNCDEEYIALDDGSPSNSTVNSNNESSDFEESNTSDKERNFIDVPNPTW
ncbi:hypothetical protein CHUAL_009510 [Chamberlinius hualienensis]